MAYSDFSLKQVKEQFGLSEQIIDLFGDVPSIEGSSWLQQALEMGFELAIVSSSEKARSEFIVVPILFDLRQRNDKRFAIYSGASLEVDVEQGLKGECDFILAKGAIAYTIQTPIFSLVEAKKNYIASGMGQCAAQMVAARLFNQQAGNDITTIFGCVTTGTEWQFLKLEGDTLFIDSQLYPVQDVTRILGVLQTIVDYYLN